jgi:hypothetical protein
MSPEQQGVSGHSQPKESPVPSLMRIVPAGILTAIILSTAACSSAGSLRSVDSGPSGKSGKSGTPAARAPLAGLTADQIVQKALKDLAAASSVRITGQLPTQKGTVAIDITDVAPASCQGTIALASTGASGSPMAAITKVDGTAYVKLNQSYLNSLHVPASESAELNGKYVKSTSSSTIADLSHLCVLSTLVNAFTQGGDTGFVEAGTVTDEGQPALALTQPNATDGGTVYVSDTASPVILSLQQTAGQLAFLDFTNFNAPVTVTAPPAADIFYGATSLA